MVTFEVNDMTCGHCVGVITKAVASVDPRAKVAIDLASHRVQIEADAASSDGFSAAIQRAGFTPVPVVHVVPVAVSGSAAVKAAPRKGCCCG